MNISYMYIYIYIYITDFELIHTIVTLVSHSHNLSQLVLLVETAYPIVNMIQGIKKVIFVLHGEVLIGFKHSFNKQLPKVFY